MRTVPVPLAVVIGAAVAIVLMVPLSVVGAVSVWGRVRLERLRREMRREQS